MTNKTLFHIPSVSDIGSYKRAVKAIPDLTASQEHELGRNLKEKNDLGAAQELVLSQLKTVVKVAQEFKNYGLDEQDLIQEGNIGLMRAVKNYDYSKNIRLYTFSMVWIKSEMQAYIVKNWKIVKIATTKNLKKLFFNFRTLYKEFEHQGVAKAQIPNHIVKALNVEAKEVQDISAYFSSTDLVIQGEESSSEEDNNHYSPTPAALIEYKTPEALMIKYRDKEKQLKFLEDAYTTLPQREQLVLKYRFLEEPQKTHKEISKELNISSERVRQIEVGIIDKLKKQALTFA